MKSLRIYDPAMCCSTGVCGPSVDPKLVRLAADVTFLKNNGVSVERFNLGHQPAAFAENPLVLAEMGPEAEHLPLFLVDGAVQAKGRYPDRAELASWFGLVAEVNSAKPRISLPMASAKCCEVPGEGC